MNSNLKFFLQWTGGSILAVFLGFMLRLGSQLDGWVGVFLILAIPYMLGIIIVQSAIMTYLFARLKQRNPDRIPWLYRLSWCLCAVVAHAVWAPSDFTDQSDIPHPLYGNNFSSTAFCLSVLAALVLWGVIATMTLDDNRCAIKIFTIWISASTIAYVAGAIILYILKSPSPLFMPTVAATYFTLIMVQSMIVTMFLYKALPQSSRKYAATIWSLACVFFVALFHTALSSFNNMTPFPKPNLIYANIAHQYGMDPLRLSEQVHNYSMLITILLWIMIVVLAISKLQQPATPSGQKHS